MAVRAGHRICSIVSGAKSSSDFSLANSMGGMESLKPQKNAKSLIVTINDWNECI